MAVDHSWTTLPNATETRGNAVFASTQFWFEGGPGGYMGTQAWRQDDGTMTYRALFSCWDADDAETGWLPGAPGYCERFGGEGTGAHSIVPEVLEQGSVYTVSVVAAGGNASGAYWSGAIVDARTNASTPIGTLYFPNSKGLAGYGDMTMAAADFLEWFEATDCSGQAVAGVGLAGPRMATAGGAIVVPVNASGDYAAGCDFSDVTACVPGHGCGAPWVFMEGGGDTQRTIPAGTPLW